MNTKSSPFIGYFVFKKLKGELVIFVVALISKQHIGGGCSKFRGSYLAEFAAYRWFGFPERVFSLMSKSIGGSG